MPRLALAAAATLLAAAALVLRAPDESNAARTATVALFSRALDGGTPNGPSTNAVISSDLRYAQIIAFESEASDLVSGDDNQVKDVFAVRRAGSFGDTGSEWKPGRTQLVSQGLGGDPADGPSFDPAVDGGVHHRATCVAFLSNATNLVSGDTNGVTDAFLAKAPSFKPARISLPSNKQSGDATTAVAVSNDCSRTAFVTGGKLYVRGSSTKALKTSGTPADPEFATDETNDLVFGAKGGVYLSEGASRSPKLVAKGGSNPSYVNRKRGGSRVRMVVYEKKKGGHAQIAYRRIGGGEKYATRNGNGDSRDPTIFNSGFNIGFESDASNLVSDRNGATDAYFFTSTKGMTINESGDFRTGGQRPSTSYYRNYVVFDSSGNDRSKDPQVYLKYLGGI